jgi:hypothetical protein
MKIIFKIIVAVVVLWAVVYGSSFIAGMTAAVLGAVFHWSAGAVAWCVRLVQFIVVFGFIWGLYLVMRQKKAGSPGVKTPY